MKNIKVSFSGHDKFDCKIDWIIKALKAFVDNKEILSDKHREKSIEILGLGTNMIKSLKYWLKVLGLIKDNQLTHFGKIIYEKDTYLEDINTLWLFHWNLTKKIDNATLYHLFFNEFYLNSFSENELNEKVMNWLNEENKNLSNSTILSDISVFTRIYTKEDGLLSELNLINKNKNSFHLNIQRTATFSAELFLYILIDYLEILNKLDSKSISISDLQYGKLSLQKIFSMSENSFYDKIYSLSQLTEDNISYKEASGIRQVYINVLPNKIDILNKIYT